MSHRLSCPTTFLYSNFLDFFQGVGMVLLTPKMGRDAAGETTVLRWGAGDDYCPGLPPESGRRVWAERGYIHTTTFGWVCIGLSLDHFEREGPRNRRIHSFACHARSRLLNQSEEAHPLVPNTVRCCSSHSRAESPPGEKRISLRPLMSHSRYESLGRKIGLHFPLFFTAAGHKSSSVLLW